MTEATNIKFIVQIEYMEYYRKLLNYVTKGVWSTSGNLLLNFGTPSISLESQQVDSVKDRVATFQTT